MPTVKIPLFTRVFENIDKSVLSDESAVQYNGFTDELGGMNVRFGMRTNGELPTRCDGLFYWNKQQKLVVAHTGVLELVTVNNTSLTSFSSGVSTLIPGKRVSFCNNNAYCFAANGSKIQRINNLGEAIEISDSDAPTVVTHVAYIDGYILAIQGTKLYWSEVGGDGTSWLALNFATAEGDPDDIVALKVIDRRIFLFGNYSTELWENDGITPFSRIPGGFLQVGCIAPDSIVEINTTLMWLDHNRYFVKYSGDFEQVISPYDTAISEMENVADCKADKIDINGRTYCVFNFPSGGRTFVYDVGLKDWSEWGAWDTASMTWLPFDYQSYAYAKVEGLRVIGGGRSNNLYVLDQETRTEGGYPVKFLRQTGFIDFGTGKKKRMETLRLRLSRGDTRSPTGYTGTRKLMLRWQDDKSGQWSSIREIDLGGFGETNIHVEMKSLGTFVSRQFELSCTDNVKLTASHAEADIEVLMR